MHHAILVTNIPLVTLSPQHAVVQIENRVIAGNGEVRWMQFTNRGFFNAAGELIEIQAVGRDIAERKLAESSRICSVAEMCH